MTARLDDAAVHAWLGSHASWSLVDGALVRRFAFADFSAALAFAVRVGLLAEKHNHHPDLEIGWGKARVLWTTHDAKGISAKDLSLAAATDDLFGPA